jgi:spore coat polysaccharide biosynthesis protein SpsF
MKGSVLVILQARMSSTRFPGKVLALLNGKPLIKFQLERILKSSLISEIVVATSEDSTDDQLVTYLTVENQAVVRGSLDDVLARYLKVVDLYDPEIVVRITGDCPLVMPELIDDLIAILRNSEADYVTNALSGTFPDGLDIEVFYARVLNQVNSLALSSIEREHVTLGIYSRPKNFKIKSIDSRVNLNELRLTVDYPGDLEFLQNILNFSEKESIYITLDDILAILHAHPELSSKVPHTMRNIAIKDWQV